MILHWIESHFKMLHTCIPASNRCNARVQNRVNPFLLYVVYLDEANMIKYNNTKRVTVSYVHLRSQYVMTSATESRLIAYLFGNIWIRTNKAHSTAQNTCLAVRTKNAECAYTCVGCVSGSYQCVLCVSKVTLLTNYTCLISWRGYFSLSGELLHLVALSYCQLCYYIECWFITRSWRILLSRLSRLSGWSQISPAHCPSNA